MPLIHTCKDEFSDLFRPFFEDCPPELEAAASIPIDQPLPTPPSAVLPLWPVRPPAPDSSSIKLLNLDPNTHPELCKTVAGDFYSHTRDRFDYSIQSVHILRNPLVWKRYQAEKQLRRQLAQEEREKRKQATAQNAVSQSSSSASAAFLTPQPPAQDDVDNIDPTELFRDEVLFHGTHKKHLPSILLNGLDPRTTTRASYGKGVYFSDSIEKCTGYIDSQVAMDQEYSIIVCCVLLGNVFVEPYSKKTLNSQTMFLPTGYDSAVAQGLFQEWIVYEKSQILPLCVVNFKTTNTPESFFRLSNPTVLLRGTSIYPSGFEDVPSICTVPTPTDNSLDSSVANEREWHRPDKTRELVLSEILNIPTATVQMCSLGKAPHKISYFKQVDSSGAVTVFSLDDIQMDRLKAARLNVQTLQGRLDQDVRSSISYKNSRMTFIAEQIARIRDGERLVALSAEILPELERIQEEGKRVSAELEQLTAIALQRGTPGILQSHEFRLAAHPYQSRLAELKATYDLKAAPLSNWTPEQHQSATLVRKERQEMELYVREYEARHERQATAIQVEKNRLGQLGRSMVMTLTEAEVEKRRTEDNQALVDPIKKFTLTTKEVDTSTAQIWPLVVAEVLMPWLIVKQLPYEKLLLLNTTEPKKSFFQLLGLNSTVIPLNWWEVAPQAAFEMLMASHEFWPIDPRRRLPNRRLFALKDYIEWIFLERESRIRTQQQHALQQGLSSGTLAEQDRAQFMEEQWATLDPCILQSIQGLSSRGGLVVFKRKERQEELDKMGSDLLGGLFVDAEEHMLIRDEVPSPPTSGSGVSKPPPAECPICQEELVISPPGASPGGGVAPERVVKIKSCRHCFHEECISQWFQSAASQLKCPMCNVMCSSKAGKAKAIKLGPMPDAVMGYSFDVRLCCYLIYIVIPTHTIMTGDISTTVKTDLRWAIVPFSGRLGPLLMIRLICLFYYGHLFRHGRSLTRNRDNVVVWNGVHLRTSMTGAHGYPAPSFEMNCWDEINQKGVAMGLDQLVLSVPLLDEKMAIAPAVPAETRTLDGFVMPPELAEEMAAQDALESFFDGRRPLLFRAG
ncbi:putative E3 ubiquitin-protein ligase dtx2 [Mortierella alpina]|nr:putative E3 ubiquitin-protein ligase dtx2 [Mortierella alpina]